jgi:hypothetical protein
MYQPGDFDYLLIDQKQIKAFTYFCIGFAFYTIFITLFKIDVINFRKSEVLQGFGLLLMIPSAFFLIYFRFENNYLRSIYLLYVLWLLSVILRGFNLNSEYVKSMVFDDYVGLFPYFTPLILLFPQKLFLYKRLFQMIVIIGIFYLFFDVVYIRKLMNSDVNNPVSKNMVENFVNHLALPSTFLLLTYSYQSNKIKYYAWFVSFVTIVFAIIRARRGMVFTFITPMIFTYFIYLLRSKKKASIFIISIFSVGLVSIYGLQFFNESKFFSSFKSRVKEDTRTAVEECFYSDMKTTDWIIGKGINGQYYCPGVIPDARSDYRPIIETDYLNIILKGGIISLLLFLLITVPAAIKGIFYSSNNFSKAAGFWVLMWLMNLYPTTVVTFTLNYILLWVAVGICYNKRIRSIPEELMKVYFSNIKVISNQV